MIPAVPGQFTVFCRYLNRPDAACGIIHPQENKLFPAVGLHQYITDNDSGLFKNKRNLRVCSIPEINLRRHLSSGRTYRDRISVR